MKKTLTILIVAIMICISGFAPVSAAEGDIALSNVSFALGGNEITVIEAGEIAVSATVQFDTLYNYNDTSQRGQKDVLLITALFDGNRLTDCKYSTKTIYGGNNTFSLGAFNVTNAEKSKISVMLWNENLVPYSKAITLSNQSFDTSIKSFTVNDIKAEINNNRNYIWLETVNGEAISNVTGVNVETTGTVSPDPASLTALNNGDILTVTAADGTEESYTVKIEKAETRFSLADLEDVTLQSNGIPTKGANDIADWNTNTVSPTATSELKTENDNTYWYYNTGTSPASPLTLGKRIWSVNTEVAKTTYSFDVNIQSYSNSYSDISVYLGTGYATELLISNQKSLPSDDGILLNNSSSKYQLRFRLGNNGRGYNLTTLDVGKWYEVKVVLRRESATSALIEYYVDGKMVYDSTYWYAHADAIAKSGATDAVKTSFTTNNYGSVGFFNFKPWSNSRFSFGIDNIAMYYAE